MTDLFTPEPKPAAPCDACAVPTSGHYRTGCRQCSLRRIARGPEFWASKQAKALTPAYMALLQALGPVEAVHLEVKAAFAALTEPKGGA